MKKDVKTDILETARKLFNEQGYNGVSMRDIAGALGISVGNLTYYFKRKEDLLEAVAPAAGGLSKEGPGRQSGGAGRTLPAKAGLSEGKCLLFPSLYAAGADLAEGIRDAAGHHPRSI